jgi:transposase
MPTLAEVVDAVVGGDTQRDTHALELTAPSGVTIAAVTVGNDDRGCAEALAIEAGLTVVEIERPRRGERRRGKSDPIDAHLVALAVLHALRLNAARLPCRVPMVTSRRYACTMVLLGARRELTTAKTRTIR